ncbi:hypothetical protein ACN20G_24230 [Streptomyces sp. BI20]|uniref:hypothetical protein n=1 Tax=Streptomyces sp. BI20 TaxID=3403460 RepID=UPI003C7368BF
MWPGENQPPGGEQQSNPRDPRQNPYQQPAPPSGPPAAGFGAPGTGEGYAYPPQPPTQPWAQAAPTPPERHSGLSTKTVAILSASAVALTAAGTAFVVFGLGDDEPKKTVADAKPSVAPTTPPPTTAPASPSANPRAGSNLKPSIEGWQVVVNPKWGVVFDVPKDWKVSGTGVMFAMEDEKKGDGSLAVSMSAPAFLKEKWCTIDSDADGREEDSFLVATGVKGADGAKDAGHAARANTGTWVWATYAQQEPKTPEETTKLTTAKEYTTKSGIKGMTVTAAADGVTKKNRCSTDGKGMGFGFKNAKGEFVSWSLFGPAHVKDEYSDELATQIMSTIRLMDQ